MTYNWRDNKVEVEVFNVSSSTRPLNIKWTILDPLGYLDISELSEEEKEDLAFRILKGGDNMQRIYVIPK